MARRGGAGPTGTEFAFETSGKGTKLARVILIRHGETDWNDEGRWQGQQDVPLNAKGRAQARLAAEYVRSRFQIQKVWSSDLLRCTQTADALDMAYATSRRLREVRYGRWEGKRYVDLDPVEQQLVVKKQAWDPDFRAPGGERMGNLVVRGRRFINEAGLFDEAGDTAIVGHGGAMRGLLVALLGLPTRAIGGFQWSNAGVTVVDIDTVSDSGEPRRLVSISALNITAHLDAVRGW